MPAHLAGLTPAGALGLKQTDNNGRQLQYACPAREKGLQKKHVSHLPQATPGSCIMQRLKKWEANLIQGDKLKEWLRAMLGWLR